MLASAAPTLTCFLALPCPYLPAATLPDYPQALCSGVPALTVIVK